MQINLMMDTAGHYKTLIYFYQATQHLSPQNSSLNSHCCDNHISYAV